jgi:hypothetical protein
VVQLWLSVCSQVTNARARSLPATDRNLFAPTPFVGNHLKQAAFHSRVIFQSSELGVTR